VPGTAWRRTAADVRRRSLRLRMTTLAVGVVAVALAAGAVAMVTVLRHNLTRDVRRAVELRAADVVALVEEGGVPERLAIEGVEEMAIQVIDDRGRVVAASANVAGEPPLADLPPGRSAEIDVPIDDDRFLALAAAADADGERLTVIVARTLEAVDESTDTVVRLLLVGVPVLLLVVGVTAWAVTGRTLGPVDAIRREVDAISARELHRRVPNPPGDDEIGRLAATMNRMLERLERSHEQQRRFVSDASHELRSPVASIRQHAEVAIAHPEQVTVPELARSVLDENLRVQRLVDDLLLLARADEGMLDLNRRPVDVDDLVFAEARRLRDTTALRVDTTAVSAGRVLGDEAALRRVLRNVVDNAARHASGRVSFALAQHDGEVVLRVDDDGAGIAPGERERVLERFVRLDDARARDAGGSGLGLAIVAELVTAHGGRVTVGDSPLGGTRVELAFSGGSAGT
jgi:signal transduction histidine kinase